MALKKKYKYNVEVHELTHRTYNEGSRRQDGWERNTQNSGESTHEEICGRERDGVGYTRSTRWTLQGISGPYTTETFRNESMEFEGGGFGVD